MILHILMMIFYLSFASGSDVFGSFGTSGLFLGVLLGLGLLREGLCGTLPRTGWLIGLCIGLTDEVILEDKIQSLLLHDTAIGLIRFGRGSFFLLFWGWGWLS